MIAIRTVLILAALSICSGATSLDRHAQEADKRTVRPNVLFILSDDQQWNAIGALGNTHVKTPNLDRLVARGITFTQTYCMGSWSGAVCLPSRAMLMSGRTLWRVNGKLEGQLRYRRSRRRRRSERSPHISSASPRWK